MGDPTNGVAPIEYVRALFEEERLPYEEGWRPTTEPTTLTSLAASELIFPSLLLLLLLLLILPILILMAHARYDGKWDANSFLRVCCVVIFELNAANGEEIPEGWTLTESTLKAALRGLDPITGDVLDPVLQTITGLLNITASS